MKFGFVLRSLVYICAFIGAGLFGDISYNSPYSSDFTWILVPAVIVGIVAAAVHNRRTVAAATI
jgi:hypothetical protein